MKKTTTTFLGKKGSESTFTSDKGHWSYSSFWPSRLSHLSTYLSLAIGYYSGAHNG
jgi:hypothetical protein